MKFKFHNRLLHLFNNIAEPIKLCILAIGLMAVNVVYAQNEKSNLTKTLENRLEDVENIWAKIWQFELFSVKGQAVQTSQVVIALILLIIGVIVSKWLTRRLRNYLRKNSSMDATAISLVEKISLYVLIIIIVLSTLQMIQIPVTMFAFLGGAIAIGLGFGSQNIFNNFISGLILMIERPVRIDDLIEIDNNIGRVASVGARCTRIRRVDGVEILVPNSMLLESNVTNRTLSDKKYRSTVSVGVAYGSPVEQVADIIQHVTDDHIDILSDPKPEVFFQEFGDNSLNFEVFFWVEVERLMELRRIQSDVRFTIDKQFKESSIVIAFPQRDVHFDTAGRPLDVKIVKSN